MIKIKMQFDDHSLVSFETGLFCEDESKAIQSAAEETDINTIVRRFGLTGQLPEQVAMPQSAEFDEIYDFHSAMNTVREAQEAFMKFPAHVRARFGNDPANLIAFVEDDGNRVEAEKLGLVMKKEEPPAAAPGTVVT